MGQEQAPRALREGGLVAALSRAGNDVHDVGDLTMRMWTPDRERRFAQNLPDVVESVRELASAVPPLLSDDDRLLVLGGNCTIALGVCAGLRDVGIEPSLVYVDRHFDLNTPQSTTEGALDWMGLAHALALEGATIAARREQGGWDIAGALRASGDTTAAGGDFLVDRLTLRGVEVAARLAPDSIARVKALRLLGRNLVLGDTLLAAIDSLGAEVAPPGEPALWFTLSAAGEALQTLPPKVATAWIWRPPSRFAACARAG